ncbi:MAG: DNA topoisomerase I [Candidatus Bathyarchaeota archaeon]|nr:DNA topoisomerase I [Candidatus Bathyarchaeota archaeon]
MKSMIHNGVMVPPRYEAQGLTVIIKGKEHRLTPVQEERAVAWAKKIGTPYVEDPVFAENFHLDFSEVLGFKVQPSDVDYTSIYRLVEEEREYKKNLAKEEKKRLAEDRKVIREANKEKYGWATFDDERSELGNYTVEPSSIFMGRGQHPFRGKWKEGPSHEDIILNLSPDAPRPLGDWKEITWDNESIWVAKWKDKLTEKMKYVWPHDSSPIKQKKEIEKFNKALELRKNLSWVKRHIMDNMTHEDVKRRKTATVSYLIDALNFRVGDEKDEDEEADTVGASTLRAEHLHFNEDGTVTFDFLGKDSVRFLLTTEVDPQAFENLKEFAESAGDGALFDEVNSSVVSEFLDEVMEGITAKVFRTCHATVIVEDKLKELPVTKDDPDYKKKHMATMANLEAAITCNHKRTIPKTWAQSLEKKKERLANRKIKSRERERKARQKIMEANEKYRERLARYEEKLELYKIQLDDLKKQLKEKEEQGKSTTGLEKRIVSKRKSIKTQRERNINLKNKHRERQDKRKLSLENMRARNKAAIEKATLQVEAYELTRDYNLGTSLKSYIDPRVYFDWGRKIEYDWRNYYSKTLEKKFSWVDPEPPTQQ